VTNNASDTVSEGKQWDENCNDNEDYGESNVGATLGIEEEHEDEETCETGTVMNDVPSPCRGMFQCGGPVLNSVENPYRLSLKDIINPTPEKEEITTLLLNDLREALLTGIPIDHVPVSKKDLAAGYQLLKMFVNHKETLLAKTQEQLLKYQKILAFVQGTEDESSIARNKNDLVAYITKNIIDKLTLKEIVVRIPFPVKHLEDGVKNINHFLVPGPHYTCTATSIYGKHIKSLIVVNMEFQSHEASKFSLTTENPGWYKDLVENHESLKKFHAMQCERRETITFEVRHMVPLIVESNIAGTCEEASLFAMFKSEALLETQRGDEVNFNYIQVAIAAGWKHSNERLHSDRNKNRKRLASWTKHVATSGLPWETRLHLHGKSVFKVCLSLILTIF
jgi:hypothetical protein